MRKTRAELRQELTSASAWLQVAFDDARDSDQAEVAGHAKAAQASVNAALGALNKQKSLAS